VWFTLSDGLTQQAGNWSAFGAREVVDFYVPQLLASALKETGWVGQGCAMIEAQVDVRRLNCNVCVVLGHLLWPDAKAGDFELWPHNLDAASVERNDQVLQ